MPAQVVRDARLGDRRALDIVVGAYLPLVYNIVRRSAESDLDVDDIVQETMIRMINGISGVREEDRLRSWVVTIALRQLTEARQRAGQERARRLHVTADEDGGQVPDRPDASIDVERSVALKLVLTDEQQELERAAAWLDESYREVLTIWWLEARGDLSRAEAAATYGEPVAHFAVRLQRMRKQLDTARSIVRVLSSDAPVCADLDTVLAAWDGTPTPLWRKRIAAHLRECATCAGRSSRLPNPEWLLAGMPLAVPPAHLVSAVSAMTGHVLGAAASSSSAAGASGASGSPAAAGSASGSPAAAGSAGAKATFLGLSGAKVAATAATVLLVGGAIAGVVISKQHPKPNVPTAATALPTPAASIAGSPSATPSATPSASASAKPSASTAVNTFRDVVPAMPKLVSIADTGAIEQGPRVGGRDNGQSAGYRGKSVWIFDDTTLKNPFGFLSNSAAITADTDASNGIDLRSGNGSTVDNGQTPVELIPRTGTEKAFEQKDTASGCTGQYCGAIFGFWPGPVIADPARHRVLFTYGKLCRGGKDGTPCSGGLGKGLGMGIASLDESTGKVTRLTPAGGPVVDSVEGRDRTIFFGPGSTNFGGAAALVVNDQAYLYGGCTYQGCYLARVPLAGISDLSQWRYYDAGKWVTGAAQAGRVAVEPGSAGQSIFYSPGLKAYVNIFMPYGTSDVRMQVGGSPFGPWSKSVKLMTTKAGSSANYALFAHPEFAQQNGLVQYLSYFNPGTGEQRLIRWVSAP